LTRRAGFLLGLVAAALAAWPAALRFQPALVWQAFAVCTAGAALVMAPLSAALAGAGPSNKFLQASTVGVLLASLPLVPFASVLRTATHHRPLGGVTFAVAAGAVVVGLSLVAARLITWAGAQHAPARAASRFCLVALAALGAAAMLVALTSGLRGGDGLRTGFFDALRVLGFATLAARIPVPVRVVRRLRGLGLAAWIAVVTVGVCLGRAPVMHAELADRCPVLHWPLLWLGG
jgi:hypothetical protein